MKAIKLDKNGRIMLDIALAVAAVLLHTSLGIILIGAIMILLATDIVFAIKGKKNDMALITGTAVLTGLVTYKALVSVDTYWFFIAGFLLVFLFAMIHERHINKKTDELLEMRRQQMLRKAAAEQKRKETSGQ